MELSEGLRDGKVYRQLLEELLQGRIDGKTTMTQVTQSDPICTMETYGTI